jgi:catechol 2,3-dioxygenase-like lactoylglutathione lyase family enzyme
VKRLLSVVGFAVMLGGAGPHAQTAPPNNAGVSFGHVHLLVKDLAANRKFWTTIGAVPGTALGTNEVMKIPNMLVLYRAAAANGGSAGSIVNHIGLKVPNTQDALARWKTAGLRTEPGSRPQQMYVFTPDDVRVEVLEDQTLKVPVAGDHIHFFVPEAQIAEVQAWYVKMFGATAGKRNNTIDVANLPGDVALSFGKSADGTAGARTQGRSLDHIGFEIVNLEAFCRKLEQAGVKFDRPYQKSPTGLLVANITDPWGTYIELSEGLNKP